MIWQRKSLFGTSQVAGDAQKAELEPRYDVIVVGGGTNGLTCASYAAKAGKKVLLLEATEHLGGACQTTEVAPGLALSRGAHLIRHFDRKAMSGLGLRRNGLSLISKDLPTMALSADGNHLTFTGNPRVTGGGLVDHSVKDAEQYVVFHRALMRLARAIGNQEAREASHISPSESLWRNAPKSLSKSDADLFDEMAISSIGHFLDKRFETPLLKGALAFDAVLGRNQSPYWPGTALNLALARSGRWSRTVGALGLPREGMGALTQSLLKIFLRSGGTYRTERRVTRLIAKGGRIRGVEIQGAATIEANQVVCAFSGADALVTDLAPDLADESQYQKLEYPKGSIAKLNLELEGLPSLTEPAGQNPFSTRFVISPSIEVAERAFTPSKYGEFSTEPIMELLFSGPAKGDDEGEGRYGASIVVQFAPYDLAGGWDDNREKFISRCAQTLNRYFPEFASRTKGGELLSPPDLERELGIAGGHWHFHKPVLQSVAALTQQQDIERQSRLVDGLFLCGGDRHPGAGVRGTAGRLAAETLLRQAALKK